MATPIYTGNDRASTNAAMFLVLNRRHPGSGNAQRKRNRTIPLFLLVTDRRQKQQRDHREHDVNERVDAGAYPSATQTSSSPTYQTRLKSSYHSIIPS